MPNHKFKEAYTEESTYQIYSRPFEHVLHGFFWSAARINTCDEMQNSCEGCDEKKHAQNVQNKPTGRPEHT